MNDALPLCNASVVDDDDHNYVDLDLDIWYAGGCVFLREFVSNLYSNVWVWVVL